jgi:hypothetical protein
LEHFTLETLRKDLSSNPSGAVYLVSRWTVIFLSHGQYFFSSRRPVVVFLFLLVA